MASLALEICWRLPAPLLALAISPGSETDGQRQRDMDLVGQAKRGDPRAMQEIYQRHADRVYSRLTRLVGPVAEREDLLQEVFIALFQRLDAFRGEAQLGTYLQRIAANKAYDHLRQRIRQERTVSPGADAADALSPLASPERQVASGQREALLWRCLDELTPKKRIAFVLRVVEGLSLKEISEQVEASLPTVAQRIRHARLELTEMVRQYENKEDGR